MTSNPEVTGMGKSSQSIGQDYCAGWYSLPSLERWKRLGEVCSSIDSHVDRTFLIEVFFSPLPRIFLKRCIVNNFKPRFSTNTRLTKGVLCPEKSIPSIESSTVR
jgi:hypothetical protein